MRKRKTGHKRRLAPVGAYAPGQLEDLARRAKYAGNPCHKKNPGDFGLEPPASPRPDKTLCDETGICKRAEAQRLLSEGILRGLVDTDWKNGFPKIVWAVSGDGICLEARLDSSGSGIYHGYPLLLKEAFLKIVRKRWNAAAHDKA
jgi:hypothetical protein